MTEESRERMITVRYARALLRFRWPVLLGGLLVTFLAASGGKHLGFDNSYRVFFGEDNPQLQAFDALENIYAKNDNVLIALAPAGGDVFRPDVIAAMADMTERSWQLPYARRVDSITNFQHSRAEGDDLIVEDLVVNPLGVSQEELELARAIALQEPAVLSRLVSADSRVAGINVTLELPGEDPYEGTEVAIAAREFVAEMEDLHPEIEFYITGVTMLNNAFSEGGQNDMKTLVPIMFGVMVLAMLFLLRSFWASFATLIIIALSTAAAMGLTGWLGIKLTPPTSVTPQMIMTLAIADSIHILVSMFAAMRDGMKRDEALVESLRVNIMPVFLTSLTTAIGFLSLNFSDAPPFRDLGNIASMGVGIAFVLSVTILPIIASLLPIRASRTSMESNRGMARLADFVIFRQRPLLLGSIAIVILLVSFIGRNETNDVFVEYFDESVAFRTDSDFVMDNLTGLYQVDFSLGTGESNGISDPAYLAKLDEFEAWYRQQPGVLQVNSISHVMKKLNQNMHEDDASMFRLPESRELAAQYLLLYEMSLPFGLDLNNQINVDKSSTRFQVVLENLSSREMRGIAFAGEEWLRLHAPTEMFSHGIGPVIMFSHISERNIRSMITGTVLALLAISFSLVFALRSVRYGLLSLLPNVIPAAMAFGLWGLLVGRVDLGLSTVSAISLGIVVDDTVHFLSKYLRARREKGLDAEDAVRYAFENVGRALLVTTLILVVGFLVMTRSSFALNGNMGWFTAAAIAFALAADFFLLPPLLIQLDRLGLVRGTSSVRPVAADSPILDPEA
jgi:predicted RND superfamily exporter protein